MDPKDGPLFLKLVLVGYLENLTSSMNQKGKFLQRSSEENRPQTLFKHTRFKPVFLLFYHMKYVRIEGGRKLSSFVEPIKAQLTDQPAFDSEDWVFEIKWGLKTKKPENHYDLKGLVIFERKKVEPQRIISNLFLEDLARFEVFKP